MVERRGAAAMKLVRVLVDAGSLFDGAEVVLDDDEQHHLEVRRHREGTRVLALDGCGVAAPGVLVARSGKLAVRAGVPEHAASPPSTIVAVGAGDRHRFLALAEKCTELGITELVPLRTERSEHVESRVRPATIERARRRAREACKQSGNRWATTVADLSHLADLASRYAAQWFIADPDGEALPAVDAEVPVAWLVGPEGGFTADELALANERLAARAVRLAPGTLRYETAVLAAAALTLDRRSRPEES
jgi:16S rRNA (uracil1498-N3)-methyltransferase